MTMGPEPRVQLDRTTNLTILSPFIEIRVENGILLNTDIELTKTKFGPLDTEEPTARSRRCRVPAIKLLNDPNPMLKSTLQPDVH
jgi:hypothetical protein